MPNGKENDDLWEKGGSVAIAQIVPNRIGISPFPFLSAVKFVPRMLLLHRRTEMIA
jgi:hypothetical protein